MLISNITAALLFPSCGDDTKDNSTPKNEQAQLDKKLAPFYKECEDQESKSAKAFEKIFGLTKVTGERNKENCKKAGRLLYNEKKLDLSNTDLIDVKFLKPLSNLEILNLTGNKLAEDAIPTLNNLENLTSLNITDSIDKFRDAAHRAFEKKANFKLIDENAPAK